MKAFAIAVLALGVAALGATPDPTAPTCPYGGVSPATQPVVQSNSGECPVASTSGTQATGTIDLRVLQGTAGAPKIASDMVTLSLVSDGQVIDQAKVKLAPDGTLEVKGLPVSPQVEMTASIDHGGATFTATSDALDPQHAQQKLDLTVYETSTAAPAWSVTMRHIITQPSRDGVDVTEMLLIHNPSDHAWIGKADASGQKQTIVLPLPPGASGVKVGGDLTDAGASIDAANILVHQAVLPGDCRYEIQYHIAAAAGVAQLLVTAPAQVQHVLVFVPNDGTSVSTTGLTALDASELGDMANRMRAFMATSLSAGQTVTIKFANLSQAAISTEAAPVQSVAPADAPGASAGDSAAFPAKTVSVVGAAVILLGGGSVLLHKTPRRAK
ncbi:MAG TPA: hypothetical protein VMD30_10490 [Tepidisphaeraceae bacterium]|nr:hypothetical protein [Tepidisphaeraceae bacterium]